MNFFTHQKLRWKHKHDLKWLHRRRIELTDIWINKVLLHTPKNGNIDIDFFDCPVYFIPLSELEQERITGLNSMEVILSRTNPDESLRKSTDTIKSLEYKFINFNYSIINQMRHLGYIDEIEKGKKYKLNTEGNAAKDWKNYKKYEKFKSNEIKGKQSDNFSKRYFISILIAIIGIAISGTISWLAYDYNTTKTGKAEEHVSKLDTLQERIELKQQKLQSQIDSIISSKTDTTKSTQPH